MRLVWLTSFGMGLGHGCERERKMKDPTTIVIAENDAALVLEPDGGVTMFLPDVGPYENYKDHCLYVMACCLRYDDSDFFAEQLQWLTDLKEKRA